MERSIAMSQQNGLEERVAKLEAEVAELKTRLGLPVATPDWIARISGSMKDYPEFEEVTRLGREFRNADQPTADKP
jgi:hypothetical protein